MSNVQILASLEQWRDRFPALQAALGKRLLWVAVASQTLTICEAGEVIGEYPISTALNGTGCEEDSFKTPLGLHEISEKIGEGELAGMIFKGREPTGELAEIITADQDTGTDQITSRILWLSGLQQDVNCGEGVDSHERYIYIHGTNEEGRIGQAVSHGCIRMRNDDVIALFEQVEIGTAVIID